MTSGPRAQPTLTATGLTRPPLHMSKAREAPLPTCHADSPQLSRIKLHVHGNQTGIEIAVADSAHDHCA